MDTKSNNVKQIPNCITKKQLVKMYHPMPEAFIRMRINLIIIDNRKNDKAYQGKSPEEIINTATVFRKEIEEFVEIYGLPIGYEL